THNGVDTHPIHFHLYDVQVLNRVTWDNIVIPNDANENGWKDTVRMSPLEDTIVALRPIIPQVPFEVPNSVRPLNPMMPAGSGAGFFNTDPQGNPLVTNIVNRMVNFGWEYVWHCHILSHEEMDMMRPVSLALPPIKPDGLAVAALSGQNVLRWNDNSITETRFVVQRSADGTTWTTVGTLDQPLGDGNTHGPRTFTDTTGGSATSQYRVVAENIVGYGSGMPSMTVSSTSDTAGVNNAPFVVSTDPVDGATGVSVGKTVFVVFSERVVGFQGSSVTLTRVSDGVAVPFGRGFNTTLNRLSVNPTANLDPGTEYQVTLTGGPSAIRSVDGRPLESTSFTFTTAPLPAPTVLGSTPQPGELGVALEKTVLVSFSERVVGYTGSNVTLTRASDGQPVPFGRGFNTTLNRLSINPTANLQPLTEYRVTLTGGLSAIRSATGIPLVSTSFTFTTRP
ncbi:MAG: Ig-like domain-containing protein, partial [Nocardioides sp.]